MAVDAPLLVRQRIFAAKLETTTGTAESLTASEGVFNVFDPKIKADIPPNEREGQGALTMLQPVPGARQGEIEFETELVGNGTSSQPPWASVLLASCGYVGVAGVYLPQTGSASYSTCTIGFYQDGRFKTLAGCTGDFTITLKAGNPGRIKWKFMGVWAAPTSVALIAPTYPLTIPPRFAGSTITIGGTSFKISEVEIAANNENVMRETGTTVSGYFASVVAKRKITNKIKVESQAFATKDWYADHLAGTARAFSCAVGSVANNTITLAAPVMYLLNPPEDEDADGVLQDSLEFLCCRSAVAGDDELTVTLT